MVKQAYLILLGLFIVSPLFADEAASNAEHKISDYVGYNKGFYIQSPDEKYKLSIGGYTQGQFSYQAVEGAANQDTLRVRRARLKFAGNVLSKDLNYELEYDFVAPKLLSSFIQYSFCPNMKARIGQYHVPFNFEALASSSDLQLVDRSIAFGFFGVPDEREFGAGIMGNIMDKKIEYNLGMFNGEGLNAVNQNNEFRYAARLVYNAMGEHSYVFSDTNHSEDPHVAIGFGAMYNDTPGIGAPIGTQDSQVFSMTPDLSAKWMGASLHAAYFYQNIELPSGLSTQDTGILAQAGYFLIPKQLELAARFALVTPDAGSDQSEYTGGVNWFFDGHKVKAQADYSLLTVDNGIAAGNDRLDHRIRLQMQVKL